MAVRSIRQPDLPVARVDGIDANGQAAPPGLAVPGCAPSPAGRLLPERERHERDGCAVYGVINPGRDHSSPMLIAWELLDGQYAEMTRVGGGDSWRAKDPFAVVVTLSALLDTRSTSPGHRPHDPRVC